MSPLALAVTFELFKRAQDKSIEEVYDMELNLTPAMMEHSDFFEGIRSLLIDKDKSPNWKHESVYDVTEEEIEWFFEQKTEKT